MFVFQFKNSDFKHRVDPQDSSRGVFMQTDGPGRGSQYYSRAQNQSNIVVFRSINQEQCIIM